MNLRPFPRTLALLALGVVVLHVVTVLSFGTSLLGSFLGNSLQILASFVAAGMCFQAAKRATGFGRSFWTLVGFGMGAWGFANFGWTYYELVLHREPPPGSMIRFLFDTHGMFFVMAIFLNQDKEDSSVDLPEVLDFLQIGILFFLVYFGAYYLPAIILEYREALEREFQVMTVGTAGIFLLALLQWRRSANREARRLFGGLALYILVYGILRPSFPGSNSSMKCQPAPGLTWAGRCHCFLARSGRARGNRIPKQQAQSAGAAIHCLKFS